MVSTMTSVEKVKIPKGYKQTEVGVIPEDWSLASLSEVSEVRMCKRILAGQTRKIGAIPFFKIGTFGREPDAYIPTALYQEFKEKFSFPKNGDVLISAAGTLGKTVVYDGKPAYFQDSNIVWLEIDKSKLINDYLYHYYKIIKWASSEGSTIARLYNSIIGASKIILPPVREQIVIANALSDVDNLIASLETLIAKKSAIKTAAMQQLLTGKKRLPGFAKRGSELDSTSETAQAAQTKQTSSLNSGLYKESGEGLDSKLNQLSEVGNANNKKTAPRPGYKQTELGEIPEDWEVSTLSTLLKDNPKYGINAAAVPLTGDLPVYLRITDISEDGYFQPSVKVGVNNPFSDLYKLEYGDLVVARTGASVGKSYLYRKSDGELIYAGFLIKLSPNLAKLDSKYLFQYLRSEAYWAWVNVMSMRSGQPGINGNEYGQLTFPLPSLQEQAAIANVLSDMDTELDALQQRLNKTQQIKQGMMQELLTGKTRLV